MAMSSNSTIISLPPQSIGEIRSIVRNRNQSPRGVDDVNNFFTDETAIRATPENINRLAEQFLSRVLDRAGVMTEYCRRLTTLPGDVAKALDGYAEENAEHVSMEDLTMMDSDPNTSIKLKDLKKFCKGMTLLQARVRGASVRENICEWVGKESEDMDVDETLIYDDSSSVSDDEEEPFIISSVYNEQSTSSPKFDVMYPPMESIDLSDEQFKVDVLMPFCEKEFRYRCFLLGDGISCAEGHLACDCPDRSPNEGLVVAGMIKRAMYAFLAKTLS